jgi:hypothetical protein
MLFNLTCRGCGAVHKVDERLIGKTGRCSMCGERMPIVAPVTEPPSIFGPDFVPPAVNDGGAAEKPLARAAEETPSHETRAEEPKVAERVRDRRTRPATERQKAFARDLGIEFREDINAREISVLIDAALEREERIATGEIDEHLKTLPRAEPGDMTAEMEPRGYRAYMVYWPATPATQGRTDYALVGANTSIHEINKHMFLHLMESAQREGLDLIQFIGKIAEEAQRLAGT